MAKGSSRQEGQDSLSERMHEYGEHAAQDIEVDAWFEYADEAAQLEAENDSLRQLHTAQMEENERLRGMLGDDAIVSFVNASGGREVHRSWRDNMLHQGRRVKPELMEWDKLPIYDQVLDRAISLDALRDYAVWVLEHDALKEGDDAD